MRIRKVIFPLVIALALVASVGAAGAWFHDEEMVGVGDINAGTLNLKVGSNDPCTQHITINNIAPGWSKNWMWKLENTGSISGKLSVQIVNLVNYDNGCNEPEDLVDNTCGNPGGPNSGELGAYLHQGGFDIYPFPLNPSHKAYYPGLRGTLNAISGTGPHSDLTHAYGGSADDLEILGPGESQYFKLTLELLEGTGNIVQSDSVEFDIIFHLDQCNPYVDETSS